MPGRSRILTVLAVIVAALWYSVLGPVAEHERAVARPDLPAVPVTVEVGAGAPGIAVPRSFLGLSTEYWTVPLLDRRPLVLRRLLGLLHVSGDGPLVLRVGGDSADLSFWDPAGARLPRWAYGLSPRWLAETAAIVRATASRLILDLNLVNDTPARAAVWAAAARRVLPRGSITAFEIGNEADIYSRREWLATVLRSPLSFAAPPKALTALAYVHDYAAYARALARAVPGTPLAGPAIAEPSRHRTWVTALLARERGRVAFVTAHRYQYSACSPPGSASYPTVARLLSAHASMGTARAVAPLVEISHHAGVPFRVTELNSVTCGGLAGVSDTFATALWAPDTLFELIRAGVDGVNVHVRAYPVNGAVGLLRTGLLPRPLLYGMVLFDRMIAPGARLVPARAHLQGPLAVKAWAVRLPSGALRVLVIDKGPRPAHVLISGAAGARRAYVERLLAPDLRARRGVTLAGQSLTTQMTWRGRFRDATVRRGPRGYVVTVPRYSAAVVLIARSSAASRPATPTRRVTSGRPMRRAARSAASRVAGVGRWASQSTRV